MESAKFDQFNDQSYAKQYKADRVYALLEKFLAKYVHDGARIMEVGCGATVPALSYCARHFTNLSADVYEPSGMADSARRVVAGLPGAEKFAVHQLAAHEISQTNPVKCDILVLNRMLHEWRLFELKRVGTFNLPEALSYIAHHLLNPGGILVMGDFSIPDGIPQEQLEREMDALLRRIGHTHPPHDYITLPQAQAALETSVGGRSPLETVETELLTAVEQDTSRVYWMIASRLRQS